MPGFYRSCIDAFRESSYEIILPVGKDTESDSLGSTPPHIYRSVDQIAVLQKADLFISHCGMNSVSESLWFGVPLVLFPQSYEQKGVALRTSPVGAGLMLTSTRAIRETAEKVLHTPSYRENARRISKNFSRCGCAKEGGTIDSGCYPPINQNAARFFDMPLCVC